MSLLVLCGVGRTEDEMPEIGTSPGVCLVVVEVWFGGLVVWWVVLDWGVVWNGASEASGQPYLWPQPEV